MKTLAICLVVTVGGAFALAAPRAVNDVYSPQSLSRVDVTQGATTAEHTREDTNPIVDLPLGKHVVGLLTAQADQSSGAVQPITPDLMLEAARQTFEQARGEVRSIQRALRTATRLRDVTRITALREQLKEAQGLLKSIEDALKQLEEAIENGESEEAEGYLNDINEAEARIREIEESTRPDPNQRIPDPDEPPSIEREVFFGPTTTTTSIDPAASGPGGGGGGGGGGSTGTSMSVIAGIAIGTAIDRDAPRLLLPPEPIDPPPPVSVFTP